MADQARVVDVRPSVTRLKELLQAQVLREAGPLPQLPEEEIWYLSARVEFETLKIFRSEPMRRSIASLPNADPSHDKIREVAAEIRQAGYVPCVIVCLTAGDNCWGGMGPAPLSKEEPSHG